MLSITGLMMKIIPTLSLFLKTCLVRSQCKLPLAENLYQFVFVLIARFLCKQLALKNWQL